MRIVQSTWVRFHHVDLARELHKRNFLVRLFTSLPWWKASKEAKQNGIPRSLIACNPWIEGVRRVSRKYAGRYDAFDAMLAVSHTRTYQDWVARRLPECDVFLGISGSGLRAGTLVKRRGGAYIMDRGSTHISHQDAILNDEHQRWGIPRKRISPWLIENEIAEAEEATLITVPSQFVKETFTQYGTPASKLCVVPYGVATEEFFPERRPPQDRFVVLFVGRFSLRKGAPYLLEAFKRFPSPEKELIIVGSVSDDIKAIINQIGASSVRFVGAVRRDKVRSYMSAAHVLVLPSIEEGLALVQAQSMACGCPVIATRNTGCEELFEHMREGLIVKPRETAAIVDALSLLYEQPVLRDEMAQRCLDKARSFSGWEKYADGVVSVAESALHVSRLTTAGS